MNPDPGRLLFVQDNDFGELAMAMYFLHRQEFAARSTLLLPPRLYESNQDMLDVRTLPYRSYDELLGSIEREPADIVFLFSGYLLGAQGLIPDGGLGELVNRVRAKGARVVTYDPFWGTMTAPQVIFGEHALRAAPIRALGHLNSLFLRRNRGLRRLIEAAGVLRAIPHLNPAPLVSPDLPTISFFNRALIVDDESDDIVSESVVPANRRPYWLFILGDEDHRRQEAQHGSRRFVEMMAGTIRQVRASGRHPVLLAPAAFLAAIRARPGVDDDVWLLPFCSYPSFVTLLMEAENVFYWNTISSSSLLRIVNRRPVFYFERGHLGGVLEPVYRQTVRWFYQGWEPPCLDQSQPLDADGLTRAWGYARGAIDAICAHLLTAPTPAQVVDGFLADVSTAPGALDGRR